MHERSDGDDDGAKVIVVTGCSSPSGIGFGVARALAAAGQLVHATVRDRAAAERALLDGAAGSLSVEELDLLDRASLTAAVERVVGAHGRLDVLVNNAGYGLIGGIEQTRLEQARACIETDFLGTMALVQEVLPAMRSQRAGQIVNVSSVFVPGICPPALGYYVAAKAALEKAMQALAVELAPFGIRVTNFQPGPVMTELERAYGDRLPAAEDPRPGLVDELYAWVGGVGADVEAQDRDAVAAALCDVVLAADPALAAQSGASATAYVARSLVDPARRRELGALLARFESSLPPS